MGFLDAARNWDPSGDAGIGLGTALSAMGRGDSLGPAIQLAEGFAQKRRQDLVERDTRGFLAAIADGAQPDQALGKFRAADVGTAGQIITQQMARMAAREETDRRAREAEQAQIRQEGRAREEQIQREQRAQAAGIAEVGRETEAKEQGIRQYDAARVRQGELARPRPVGGFLQAIGAGADQLPFDLPGTPVSEQTLAQAEGGMSRPDITGAGFYAARKDGMLEAAEAEAARARQADTDFDNETGRLTAEGLAQQREAAAAKAEREAAVSRNTARAWNLIKSKAMTREQAGEAFGDDVDWMTIDKNLEPKRGPQPRLTPAEIEANAAAGERGRRSAAPEKPVKPEPWEHPLKVIGGGKKDAHQIKTMIASDSAYAATARAQIDEMIADAEATPQLPGESVEAWTERIRSRLRQIRASSRTVGLQ